MDSSEHRDSDELRIQAGRAIQQWSRMLAERLSADDAWRLLLCGCLAVMLPLMGDKSAADVLRELADDIEHGREPEKLN